MALVKFSNYYSDYRDSADSDDISNYDVYSEADEKIGSVDDILVDENDGRFRYLIIDTGSWIFGKKVLLPIGRSRIAYDNRRVYALGMTKEQVKNLPEFNNDLKLDHDYEENVRGVYRPTTATMGDVGTTSASATPAASANYDRNSYHYDQEPALYGMNERDHQRLRLYEERLVANKTRQKVGEVSVGKHVETQTASVSVPIERERVVIERTTPTNMSPVGAGETPFGDQQVARVEVYEETPDVHKETFVSEEVSVRKEIDRDVVNAQETIRRERLDIDGADDSIVEGSNHISSDRI